MNNVTMRRITAGGVVTWLLLMSFPVFALDEEAETYVRLALEHGQYDADYVDAYLGPEEWALSAKENTRPRPALARAIAEFYAELQRVEISDGESPARYRALLKNVRALDARARMLNGESFSFAEEARLLYDVDVPRYDFSDFDAALEAIETLIPGTGSLADRVDRFRASFEIPTERRDSVVRTAIDECRERTLAYIGLPDTERFTLEYVNGKNWTGYNWYQGDNESLMQVNVDFPTKVDAAIQLGCHEGYPGHHVWNVLIENELLNGNGWVEYSLFPLFSPMGLIAEGSANYGVSLAFPGNQQTDYEQTVLFPLAGIDPQQAIRLAKLNRLMSALDHAQTATAQLYLDGEISRDEAIEQRQKYSLTSRARAEQSVRFIEQYRSYVLNYSLGEDIVRSYVEGQSHDAASRWAAFKKTLTELSSASDMLRE